MAAQIDRMTIIDKTSLILVPFPSQTLQ